MSRPLQKPSTGDRSPAARKAAASSGSRWSPTLKPPSKVRDVGGLLTGIALYTVAITYIRYGPAGWTGWLSAKFLNKPMTDPDDQNADHPNEPETRSV